MEYTDAQKTQIADILTKWKEKILGKCEIRIEFQSEQVYDNGGCVTADIECSQWKYGIYHMNIYPELFNDDNNWDVENIIVHELVHCALAPLTSGIVDRLFNDKWITQDHFNDMNEFVTSNLTRIIMEANGNLHNTTENQ